MTRREKILEKWQRATDENIDTVEAVLGYYGFTCVSNKGGSHKTFYHPKLVEAYTQDPIALEDFGPEGLLTIPISGGKRVKGIYLRNMLKALSLVLNGGDFS